MQRRVALAIMLAGLGAAWPGAQAAGPAGADAEVRRMIESLRPATAPAPAAGRTRNLVIEPAPPATAAAPSAAPGSTGGAGAEPARPPSGQDGSQAAAPAGGGLSLAIEFEPNSSRLRPESGDTLGALVAAMISPELRRQRFVIEGHTDATGTPAQNLRLSRDRAEQVRLYLMTLGVEAERLKAVGKGASEPVNARDPRSPENRRVRVVAQP